jgi:NitT/TauT family transport system permease protein
MMPFSRKIAFLLSVAGGIAGLLVVWQYAAGQGSVRFFFSSPLDVAAALRRSILSGQAAGDLYASGFATLCGLGIGLAIGALAGMIALALAPLRPVISALISVLAALPILALAPMFLIWFGVDLELKVALGALLSSLVVASQVLASRNVLTRDLDGFLTANRIQGAAALYKIILPLAAPAALRRFGDALNAAFLGVFVGEFVAADRGLGFRILRAGSLYSIDQVLASTLLALVLLLGLQASVRVMSTLIIDGVQRASIPQILQQSARPEGRSRASN